MKLPQSADHRPRKDPLDEIGQQDDLLSDGRSASSAGRPFLRQTASHVTQENLDRTERRPMRGSMLDGQGPQQYGSPNEPDYAALRDPPRRGRPKWCGLCGTPMSKSSRRVLSALSGTLLILLGAGLMILYGLAINFYQVPWFATFALPAAYYVGSLFVGVGILFFFIRERVWICLHCGQVDKR